MPSEHSRVWRVTGAAGRALARCESTSPAQSPLAAPRFAQDPASLADDGAGGIAHIRGACDASALRRRFSDPATWGPHRVPRSDAALLRDTLEQVRVEALGSRRYPGCRQNLAAFNSAPGRPPQHELVAQVAALLRERLDNAGLGPSLRRNSLAQAAGAHLERLAAKIDDQKQFAHIVLELLAALGLHDAQDASSLDTQSGADDGETAAWPAGAALTNPSADEPAVDVSNADMGADFPGAYFPAAGAPGAAAASVRANLRAEPVLRTNYRIYTTQFDEVVRAQDLCDAQVLARLRRKLDEEFAHVHRSLPRLVNRLHRRVQALRNWSWAFDQEEGLLDSARLARTVADPANPLSFKQEKPSVFRDTVVTLLVDNSGSMRGLPIALAAVSAELLARALERCGVKVEILGFTTRGWKGGAAFDAWVAAGKPPDPGRLAQVRHIVYKSADVPWRRARLNLGVMLHEDLLKDNIDAEALLWAHRRLMSRPERRRILIVISDGAPAEDASTSMNRADYLDNHLRAVTRWIESLGHVELLAIGIGFDVRSYYRRAVNIADAAQLGNTLTDQLTTLLASPSP